MSIPGQIRLLLLGSSAVYGGGYLAHAEEEIRDFLGSIRSLLFVPYALSGRDAYAERVVEHFAELGFACSSIHRAVDPGGAVDTAEAIYLGGGNTFRLLKTLHELGLVERIRRRVLAGMPYMGVSAGGNVACPTIRTTNDMPIVQPPTFDAMALFPYQLNQHYVEPPSDSTHMGETRDERLLQYLEDNERPVIALREGAMLRVEQGVIHLKGLVGARIFRRGVSPYDIQPPATISL